MEKVSISNSGRIASKYKFNIFLIFCVSIGGCFYGYNIGAMSGVLLFIKNSMPISQVQASLFVAAFLIGVSLVMIITGYLADIIGRKKVLILAASFSIISIVFMAASQNFYELISGRFMAGLASGMITITAPLYISEIIPFALRGRAAVMYQLFLCFGILLSTIISLSFHQSENWRYIFLYALIPTMIFFIVVLFISESPRWLTSKQNFNEAFKILLKTRPEETAKKILNIMIANNRTQEETTSTILTNKRLLFPLALVILIAMLNQLTGINVILQYDSLILSIGGMHIKLMALTGSLLITAFNFIMTIIAITIVDKIERKKILRIGLIGIICCLISISFAHGFITDNHAKAIITIAGLLGFIMFFALAPGALVYVFIAEILPQKIRSKGMAISLFASSIAGALLSAVFLPLERLAGLSGIFIICTITTLIYFYVSFLIPNTKGKTLEEIENNFLNNLGDIIDVK